MGHLWKQLHIYLGWLGSPSGRQTPLPLGNIVLHEFWHAIPLQSPTCFVTHKLSAQQVIAIAVTKKNIITFNNTNGENKNNN